MPKPTDKKRSSAASSSKPADQRFANFGTDPRFRLPSGKTKTKIDRRFKQALKDDDFTETAKVDRYGRKLKSDSGKKALKQLYEAADEEDEDEDDDLELDDKAIRRELKRVDEKYDPARGGGFSESESDSDSDTDSDVESDDAEAEPDVAAIGDLQGLEPDKEEIPEGEITQRIAIVNLDWDHVKSTDLMAMFTSFVPPGGAIEKISIYPSEFGKERMAKEEAGPPKAIFKTSKTDVSEGESDGDDDEETWEDDEDDEEEIKKDLIKEGDDQDFNTNELRAYQLDRLRYYYAVMICSDKATAKAISDATDGREFQASSNFLDLRFIPDDTTFDDTPRDECTSVPDNYKPIDFVTDALSHSKVKLTWDMHPEEASRKDSIKRAFMGDQKKMTEDDMDLHLYLASDNSDDDEEPEAGDDPALSKKELARQKMREALGLGAEPTTSKRAETGPVGDLQITFTSALSEKAGKAKDNAEETTIEKYQRKEKERKQKRKQSRAEAEGETAGAALEAQDDDLGFDDPFFTSAPGAAEGEKSKTSVRKEERRKKREAKEADEKARAAEKEKLELLMMGEDGEDDGEHFDMKEIVRAEKRSKKKRKDRKERADRGGLQEDFKMDMADPRFAALFENPEFAIDPSHAKFEKTAVTQQMLEEGRKKRKGRDEPEERRLAQESKRARTEEDEFKGLVASVRRKAEEKARAKRSV